MEISSASYNDYYTNPKAWQATNENTLSLNQNQGDQGQQAIKEAIDSIYPDAPNQIVS